MQYSLNELFNKTPGYNEPVPNFKQLRDVDYHSAKIKLDRQQDENQKMTKREIAEANNYAILNQNNVRGIPALDFN